MSHGSRSATPRRPAEAAVPSAPRPRRPPVGCSRLRPDYLRFLVHSLAHESPRCSSRRPGSTTSWHGDSGGASRTADGGRAIWQWGNDPGYKNFVIGRPADGQGVVVFTNGDHGASCLSPTWCASSCRARIPRWRPRHRPRWLLAMAGRPVDLRPRLDEPAVRALLELSVDGRRRRGRTHRQTATGGPVSPCSVWWSRIRGRRRHRCRNSDRVHRTGTQRRSRRGHDHCRWPSCPTGAVRASPHH